MNVDDFFKKLSFGELSGLHVGGEGAGFIRPDSQNRMVSHINSVLSVLSSRFSHNLDYVIVELMTGVNTYVLDPKHMVSDTSVLNVSNRYIIDTVQEPFPNNVIKILNISEMDDPATVDIDETRPVVLNKTPYTAGVRMLSDKSFRVADPVAGQRLMIEYRASIPQLSVPVNKLQEIKIIPTMIEALEAGVAARVFRGMNGDANLIRAKELEATFESLLNMTKMEDLLNETAVTDFDKIADKGFV
jgi:hypothetical protein